MDRSMLKLYKTVKGRNCYVGYCDDDETLDRIFADLEEEKYKFNKHHWIMSHANL